MVFVLHFSFVLASDSTPTDDIIEILEDFSEKARNRNIDIQLISERGTVENPDSFIQFFKLRIS